MAKRKKNKVLFFIAMSAALNVGIFTGSLMSSPSFRSGIFSQVNKSKYVQAINNYLAERKFDIAFLLPVEEKHPARK